MRYYQRFDVKYDLLSTLLDETWAPFSLACNCWLQLTYTFPLIRCSWSNLFKYLDYFGHNSLWPSCRMWHGSVPKRSVIWPQVLPGHSLPDHPKLQQLIIATAFWLFYPCTASCSKIVFVAQLVIHSGQFNEVKRVSLSPGPDQWHYYLL